MTTQNPQNPVQGTNAREIPSKQGEASMLGASGLITAGVILCCTGIGAVVGIPLIVIGLLLPLFHVTETALGGSSKWLKGDCPWCGTEVTTPRLPGFYCGACKKRIVIRGNRFLKVE